MTPPAWAQPHPYAEDFDTFWLVNDLPPAPWPEWRPGDWDPQKYGPPGTVWRYSMGQYWDRLNAPLFSQSFQAALKVLRDELQVGGIVSGESQAWTNPGPTPPPDWVPRMRWINVTIVGKLGSLEQINHVLKFRTKPAPDVDQSEADLQTFANQVRDTWAAFFNGNDLATQNATKISHRFNAELVYTEVHAAYLEQTAAASFTTHPGKRGPVKDFHYPRPAYLVPTQYAQFAQNAVKGTADPGFGSLPYEVALCLTHTSGLRGPRNRGRIYLGGLGAQTVDSHGMFTADVQAVGAAYGKNFVQAINAASGNELHIVSRAYATSVRVNGVSTGLVPDSQRRRRRSLLESSLSGWTG